jgi:hypothetical protein
MSENTGPPEESRQEGKPENIPSFPSSTGTAPETKSTESLPKQTTPEMEVHHHSHIHAKTKWQEHLFQFFMLFLAVFLGFLAERASERETEKDKEKEYIQSLIADTDNDYALSRNLNAAILEQIKQIDTLQTLFFSDLRNNIDSVRKCYELSSCIRLFYSEFFNERTTTQLLSSGNMRLIKKQGVADSIMEYHSFIKFLELQKQFYVNSVNECMQSMYNVYDISYLRSVQDSTGELMYPVIDVSQMKLRTTDPDELKKFVAILENTKLVASNYRNLLIKMNDKARRLYLFLIKKYKI